MADPATKVAPGVYRLGNELVNCYLLEDGNKLTLVDAGLPSFRGQLDAHLRWLGRTIADIDAVVLTHAHQDHVGMAERVRRDAGARVWVPEADADIARTGKLHKRDGSLLPYLRHPAAWKLLAMFVRSGDLRYPKIAEVATFTEGDIDAPGRPRAVPTPGHSPGHVALHVPDRGVVFAGDAMCTYNVLTGARGPQVMPRAFVADAQQQLASLAALEPLYADVMLFGHGEPWTEGTEAAVARARQVGIT